MTIKTLRRSDIKVAPSRQRSEVEGEALVELAESIRANGLLHPIIVRDGNTLVCGERRLRALESLSMLETSYKFAGTSWNLDFIPVLDLGDMSPLEAELAELDENTKRADISFQDKARATAKIMSLRTQIAARDGKPAPHLDDIAAEVRGASRGAYTEDTRREIILAPLLDQPHLKGAKTLKEAWDAHVREETRTKNIELAATVGATFGRHSHTLIRADCLDWARQATPAQFDVILTDPPYGVGADSFGDAGGRLVSQTHGYSDSPETWKRLIGQLAGEWYRLAKDQAHLYICCDIDGFHFARSTLNDAGWWVHRTPLINFKVDGSRVPWPENGPQRKWEMVLYAVKGKKRVTRIYPDVIETKGDENLAHGAQKPVALYTNLLKRSVKPGDSVLDCFGGTGTIIPAAHELKCRATYVEMDEAYFGIAVQRLNALT